ncbi:DUF262 domain-containing protein [Microbacterium sp. JZ101]
MSASLEFVNQIASNSSNLSVNHFDKAFGEGALVLRPAFQRNLVWNESQQSFLIDSILRGLPVPEVYVQTTTAADGSERLTVVDGQQRISACLRFIHGELRLEVSDDLDPRWRGRTFGEIGEALQARFRGFKLIVRDLPDLTDTVLREVFRRLNKTVEPLEPQELRHAAYTGPFIKFIETLAAVPILTEVGVFSARDYQRRRNDEFVAEVVYAVVSGAFPNKKDGLDTLFRTMDLQGMPQEQLVDLKRRFGRVLGQLAPIAADIRRSRFRNKSDFYSLMIYLAREAERLPLNDDGGRALADTLKEFSTTVNDIKKEEAEGNSVDDLTSTPQGESAVRYLRAVERAASDRLNRVRRQESIAEMLGTVVATGSTRALSSADEAWLTVYEEETVEEPADGDEKAETERVILGDAQSD